jgi:hypothetical protein
MVTYKRNKLPVKEASFFYRETGQKRVGSLLLEQLNEKYQYTKGDMSKQTNSEKAKPEQSAPLCRYCQQPMNEKANVCHHCERDQRPIFQYFASSTAFLMVIIAISQAFMAWLQYDESKKKRVEADDVLKKAKQVFGQASSNAHEMKLRASETFDFSKAETKKAVDRSMNVLRVADRNAQLAKEVTLNVKSEMKETVTAVNKQLDKTDLRIIKTEREFENIKGRVESLKGETATELGVLKNRNNLTYLADNAIHSGDRSSFEKLIQLLVASPEPDNAIGSEILRIKNFYGSFDRIPDDNLEDKNPDGIAVKDISTQLLISDLLKSPDWVIRGRVAKILRHRKEKIVAEAFIEVIKKEKRLDVVKASLDSFSTITGYKKIDVLDSLPRLPVLEWWNQNKDRVSKDLK